MLYLLRLLLIDSLNFEGLPTKHYNDYHRYLILIPIIYILSFKYFF